MQRIYYLPLLILCYGLIGAELCHAALDNNWVINHAMAQRIEELKESNGFSAQDFNACQINWSAQKLDPPDPYSQFHPHRFTFKYSGHTVITLTNVQDGDSKSVEGLGLNCIEFNDYIYLFFDTLDYETRTKFALSDLAYVTISSDKGLTWSPLKSLHSFSAKAKFALPQKQFEHYVKVFGNKTNHVLSIFNVRDETTYLFNPKFDILRSVPVYNRLSDFNHPTDFYYFKNTLYLARGGCEQIKGQFHCPERTYLETSRDFGKTWKKEKLPYIKKSYFITHDNTLYHFYFKPCAHSWFAPIPAWNRSIICGHIMVRKLNILGQWEKPRTILKTADNLLGVYQDTKPLLVWKDIRYHKSRACGYIPVIGCVDAVPFVGPTVIYAGEIDMTTFKINEYLIEYKN